MSYLLVMPLLVWYGRDRAWLLPAFFAGALATSLCLLSHLFWPTEMARPVVAAGWIAWLRSIDSPLAASPSGHVALPIAITVVLATLRVRAAAWFAAWSVVLMVTVLTTGQHFVADVAWGAAVGLLAAAVTALAMRWRVDLRTLAMILLEWLCVVVTLRVAFALDDWRLYLVAAVIISTRQHALFILYHDAAHYHLTRHRRVNDFLINVAIGVPGVVPVEFYRPLHLAHHRHVGSALDPERQFLYRDQRWQFRPLGTWPLVRQLIGDLLLLNTLRTMRAYRQAGGAAVRPTVPILAACVVWTVIAGWLIYLCSAHTLTMLAALWFGPLFTVSVLLQKVRSFSEHSGGPGVTPGWSDWTYSWCVGWLGRAFIWPYHINLHLQHHRNPNTAWYDLPSQVRSSDHVMSSRGLVGLLWLGRRRVSDTRREPQRN
ncbi:fatty acid desaturase family protein [Paraburkholderia sp. D15]|uniref:fatty acid desaturase family protein n=1 Tax=Paraburkholderia sp. D15 TaxID=2880218 RepID=UPI00247A1AB0|nr:fatty acid desaturase family protein [Paraburkholderia sp. D15]WGS49957.1 fatty acid desaturase family protein [Paraburkholderia sp. D15]